MSNRCPVCGGRAMQTEDGARCMNAACEGSKRTDVIGVKCDCGESMTYTNSSPYGDRTYTCNACGDTKTY